MCGFFFLEGGRQAHLYNCPALAWLHWLTWTVPVFLSLTVQKSWKVFKQQICDTFNSFSHTNDVEWSLQAAWQLWRGIHLHTFKKKSPSPWLSVGNVVFPSLSSELLWLSTFTVLYVSPLAFLSMSFSSTFNSASCPFCQRWKCQQSFWKPLSPTRPVLG